MNIKINRYSKHMFQLGKRLQDVRFVGQVVFVIIVLLISWSGVKSIQTNYALQKQITGFSQQNDLQKLQNANLQLSNEYYKSNQYLELSARQNFGMAAAGEKEIVVPKAVALSKTKDVPVVSATRLTLKARPRNNFEAWVDFFLHRNASAH